MRTTSAIAVAALAGAVFAGCGSNGGSAAIQAPDGNGSAKAQDVADTTAAVAPVHLNVVIKSDEQHGKKGPDGNWHDAFLPANYSVKAGQKVTITVANYDDMPHTFTAPDLNVNARIPGGDENTPGTKTFTFTAPKQAGSYAWYCALPCDAWAMAHDGYMRGHVTVVAA